MESLRSAACTMSECKECIHIPLFLFCRRRLQLKRVLHCFSSKGLQQLHCTEYHALYYLYLVWLNDTSQTLLNTEYHALYYLYLVWLNDTSQTPLNTPRICTCTCTTVRGGERRGGERTRTRTQTQHEHEHEHKHEYAPSVALVSSTSFDRMIHKRAWS